MGYYDIEDAVIIDDNKPTNSTVDKDVVKKVSAISNGISSDLLEKSSVSIKAGVLLSLIGVGYALWKRKSVVKFGIIGAVSGLVVANLFNEHIKPNISKESANNETNNDEESK